MGQPTARVILRDMGMDLRRGWCVREQQAGLVAKAWAKAIGQGRPDVVRDGRGDG